MQKRKILWIVGILVVTAGVLFWMGRTPICKCGSVKLWSGDINGPENSQQLVDPYSFTHALHGLAFYGALHLIAPEAAIATRLVAAVAVESGWEVLENTDFIINRYRSATVSNGYFGDSIVNSISDVLFMILGFWFARRFPVWFSVVLFVAVELALLLWIRDSLIINIVMLVHPLEWLKNWQAGM